MTYMDLLRSMAGMVRDWRMWVNRIAEAARLVLPDVEVYVIGSVVRGDWVGGSDVDVLLVSGSLPDSMLERAEIKSEVEDRAKLPVFHPFEIHLVSPVEADDYFRRAGKDILRYAEGVYGDGGSLRGLWTICLDS